MHAEGFQDPLPDVAQPEAGRGVRIRLRTGLNSRAKLVELALPKTTGPATARRHSQVLRTLVVVPFNPFAQRLYIHAVRLGSLTTLRSPNHYRYSPQGLGPARLLAISRNLLQFFCCVVVIPDRYRAYRLISSCIGFLYDFEPKIEEMERGHTP